MYKLQPPPPPPQKCHSPFSHEPPLKIKVLSRLPFLKIWWEVQTPQQKRGVHTMVLLDKIVLTDLELFKKKMSCMAGRPVLDMDQVTPSFGKNII